MSIKLKKVEKLPTNRFPQVPRVSIPIARPQQGSVVMGQPDRRPIQMAQPYNQGVITSYTHGPVNRYQNQAAYDRKAAMYADPLGWFGKQVSDFGMAIFNPWQYKESAEQLGTGLGNMTEEAQRARDSQISLQETSSNALIEATRKLNDPNLSDSQREALQQFIVKQSRWNKFWRSQFETDTQRIEQENDPIQGAMNTVVVASAPFTAAASAGQYGGVLSNGVKNSAKEDALNYLIRQELMNNKTINVVKQGGGNVPIPVRVNKNIPVRYEPSNDVLDARLSKEVDVVSGRHEKALAEAGKTKTPLINTEAVNTKFNAQYDNMLTQRDKGTLPQRIDVVDGDAPVPKPKKPKVTIKKDKSQPDDLRMLNIKISKVKDPKRKAELIAERARLRAAGGGGDKPPRAPKQEKPPVDAIPAQESGGKSPGIFSRAWRSVSGVLEKNGTGGKMINRAAQKARDYSEKATGADMTYLHKAGFDDIDDTSMARVWDAIEAGSAKGLDNTERRVAAALVRTMRRIHRSAADDAAMDIGDRGSNYLPHWYKNKEPDGYTFFRKEFNKRDSNLERKRITNDDGYEKTKESIARYIQNANERIGRAKEFGQGDEKLAQMFDVAKREGYDVDQVTRYAKTALGDIDYNSTGHKISSGVRQVQAVTSLQKAAVANVGQQVNTITVTGLKNWAKGTIKYMTDANSRDWARKTGVFGDHVLGNLQKQYAIDTDTLGKSGFINHVKKHWLVPGMQAVEKFNRANGVLAGKAFAEDLLKKAAKGDKKSIRLLNKYFPTLRNVDDVTEDMITDAAREVIKRTQFKVDPIDLPNWTSGSVGKVIFQFRSFGYKQTQFLAREVIGEALHGNFAPMTRFLAIGVPAGAAIDAGREMILGGKIFDEEERKKLAEQPWYEKAFRGFSQIGGGGLPLSEGMNIKRSIEYADDNNKVSDPIVGALGPTAGDIKRAAEGLNDGITKGEWKNLATWAASNTPILGPLATTLVKNAMTGETKNVNDMNSEELDKYKKTTYAKFMDGMSDKDKDLMAAVNDEDYSRLGIQNGKFTQDQVDDMQAKYNRELFKAGLPVRYIKGIKDDEFKTLPPELQSMVVEASMVGTKRFAESEKYDKTAEAVVKKAMENAWPEVGDIKGNNQIAMDYLQAQRDYAKAEGDDGKQFDVVKGFWTKAIKQQYSDKVKNLYGNSISDIKRLYEGVTVNGVKYEISRQDMDQAVALDDRLLAAGLRDTPKFSNKTREAYGYGEAPSSKLEGIGYSKSSSSSGSSRSGSGRSSRSGRGSSGGGSTSNPYRFTVARGSKSSLKSAAKASASGGKASVKLAGASSAGNVAKPKVSIKKNKV